MHNFPSLTFLILSLLGTSSASAQLLEPQPTPVPKASVEARRNAIQVELDGNHDAVQELYASLDVTPDSEDTTRAYLEGQIHQFDARSDVLFEELDVIDEHEFQQKRRIELQRQADQLIDEAQQLRDTGHVTAAISRETKAKLIKQSIKDGTWKLMVEKEWSCEQPESQIATAVQLVVEVEKLKAETKSLQAEVNELRLLIAKFEKQLSQLKKP